MVTPDSGAVLPKPAVSVPILGPLPPAPKQRTFRREDCAGSLKGTAHGGAFLRPRNPDPVLKVTNGSLTEARLRSETHAGPLQERPCGSGLIGCKYI